jgi:hypothetical protein
MREARRCWGELGGGRGGAEWWRWTAAELGLAGKHGRKRGASQGEKEVRGEREGTAAVLSPRPEVSGVHHGARSSDGQLATELLAAPKEDNGRGGGLGQGGPRLGRKRKRDGPETAQSKEVTFFSLKSFSIFCFPKLLYYFESRTCFRKLQKYL